MEQAREEFIEQMGRQLDQFGLQRMSGRVLGLLLMSEKEHLSMNEIATTLQASKASISTATRVLIDRSIVERVGITGDRKDYYRLREEPLAKLFQQRIQEIHDLKMLMLKGLNLVGRESKNGYMMEEMATAYQWFEEEFPKMIERWAVYKKKLRKHSPSH